MTFTIKPAHLAVLAFLLGVALTAAVALAVAGGSSEEPSAVAANVTATAVPSATSQPTPAPTAVPAAPPTQPPAQEPQQAAQPAAPAPAANVAPAPVAPAPTEAPPAPTGPTEAELEYRRRVQSLLAAHIARLDQYNNTPSMGLFADIQELASIVVNYANAIASVQPVPPRFQLARDRVVDSHLSLYDHMQRAEGLTTEAQVIAWLREFDTRLGQAGAALVDFNLVVGTDFPTIGGLR
jgi:hypothetical protein